MSQPEQPRIVFLDVEAGGLRPKDRPWEIGAIERQPDGREVEHLWFVADFQPGKADPQALRIGGFYQRHPLHIADEAAQGRALIGADLPDGVRFHGVQPERLVAFEVERLVRGSLLIGCNLPFYDAPRIEAMLNRHGHAWTGHYRPVCATTLAAGYLAGQGIALPPETDRDYNKTVGAALGVDRDGFGVAHTALADARYARGLYDGVRNRVEVHA